MISPSEKLHNPGFGNRKVSAIAAVSLNHVLGLNNKLIWTLPDDWKNFAVALPGPDPFDLDEENSSGSVL